MHLPVTVSLPATQLAEATAQACRADKNTTIAMAIVIRPMRPDDPDGFGGIAIAAASAGDMRSHYYAFGTDRLDAPVWASTHAMALARRIILKAD